MTRPAAVIEGDLALPLARPFDGLPPPFGSHRRAPERASAAAPARAFLGPPGLLPGAKHILFYSVPEPRVDARRFDVAMAEAKSYMERAVDRPRSSRSDYLLAVAIVAGCSVALAWLIASYSKREPVQDGVAQRTQVAVSAGHVASVPALASAPPAAPHRFVHEQMATALPLPRSADAVMPSPATSTPAYSYASVPKQKVPHVAAPARIVQASGMGRWTSSRPLQTAARRMPARRSEWVTQAPIQHDYDAEEQRQWRDWAAQWQRPPVTARVSSPALPTTDWNASMTQRRITDDPAAFAPHRAAR